MKMAVFMDEVSSIKAYKDSSVAMLKSAQSIGIDCYYFTQNDLYSKDGKAFAIVSKIVIIDENLTDFAEIKLVGAKNLSDFDIILVRKDPPFTMEYIYAMQILALAEKDGVLVANKPATICLANEKINILNYPDCIPPSIVTSNHQILIDFWQTHQNVIFKPLDAMGGQGIFHVTEDNRNLSAILDVLTKNQTQTIMAQKYIPDIATSGDKRILLIAGKPIPYALARLPAPNKFRGNLAYGASSKVVELTDKERLICEKLSISLLAQGLYFVGIDVIGGFLTEINITSPTCIKEIEKETGLDIARQYIEYLVSNLP